MVLSDDPLKLFCCSSCPWRVHTRVSLLPETMSTGTVIWDTSAVSTWMAVGWERMLPHGLGFGQSRHRDRPAGQIRVTVPVPSTMTSVPMP